VSTDLLLGVNPTGDAERRRRENSTLLHPVEVLNPPHREGQKVRLRTYKKRDRRQLCFILLAGLMIGSGMGVATKMLTPVMIGAKSAPVEITRAKRKTLLPLGDTLGTKQTA
jgi:hypothetical protein